MRGEGGAIGYVNGKHEAEALKTRLSRYIFRIAGMQTDKKNRIAYLDKIFLVALRTDSTTHGSGINSIAKLRKTTNFSPKNEKHPNPHH